MTSHPVVFEEFFELGLPDSASPFLTPKSRKWGINLELKSSIASACFLLLSFILSFFEETRFLSHICLLFVYFLAGIPSLIHSIEDIMLLNINIDVLMTLAAFSSIFIGGAMEGGLLLVLFAISGSMEEMVSMKAKGAISSLKKLSPKTALVVEGKELVEKAVQDVMVGEQVLVRAGEVVPLDGVVAGGRSLVDLAHLTGEAEPFVKEEGDEVPAGGIATDGSLTLTVKNADVDSTLSRIIQLVTEAQEAKPKLQRTFDRFSSTYAITIISLATLFALIFPLTLGLTFLGDEGSIYRALAFLIAASPCALIIAIPTAYLSAISSCARNGIMLKGGVILDSLAGCGQVAFDKTGTLTTGNLQLSGIDCDGGDVEEALSVAYGLERGAKHPIAKAICDYAKGKGVAFAEIEQFKVVPGYGLEGVYEGSTVYIGNPKYLEGKTEAVAENTQWHKEEGRSIALLLLKGKLYLFHFEDELRGGIGELVQKLKKRFQMVLIMLTGDHEESALKVSKELGFDKTFYDLKPEDKLHHISSLSKEGDLAMVGDGINDAPALARASVGIAMGKVGSGTALEAADIVLLQDNIDQLAWLVAKAKKTYHIVWQNLILATGAILIASIPALAGYIPLWLAVILHEGGTVLVGLNALRLLKK